MTNKMNIHTKLNWKLLVIGAAVPLVLACAAAPAKAQRVLGADISYWNRGSSSGSSDGISQAAWNTAFNTPDQNGNTRQFVVRFALRAAARPART